MRRTKTKAQRYQQPDEEAPTAKRQRMDTQSHQTNEEGRVNPNDTSRVEKGKSSIMTPREVLGLPELPPTTHELAAFMQFDTLYELVEWIAQQLQEVSERLAQEHKDRVMIQKSLIGAVELEEQQELDRIGRH